MAYKDQFHYTRDNLKLYRKPVLMPGGWHWNLTDTLRKIDLYYNSQFESGNKDRHNRRKFFYNIVKPACDVASKFIDLDTKNILLYSEKAGDDLRVWLMRRDLQNWMKNEEFGVLINELGTAYPKDGHLVVKRNKGEHWKRVKLVNLRLDPSVSCLEDSPFVYELLMMTRREIQGMNWDKQAVKQLLNSHPEDAYVLIYECYDYNFSSGKKWVRTFRADFLRKKTKEGWIETKESQINATDEFLPGLVLYQDEVDELPYREKKWEEVEGRWLGMGFVEYLFDNQIRQNELANTKARSLEISSIHLFQSADELIARNVIDELDNGDILRTSSGITPVANEERNLAAWNTEEARWDLNSERKTFSFDITRGEELPSGTPLGVAKISAGMVESYFALKRENFGLFLKDIIMNDVLPSFKKQNRKEHLMKFFSTDEEIERLRQVVVDSKLRKSIWDYALKSGTIPSRAAIEMEKFKLENSLKRRKDIDLTIPDSFYEDLKTWVEINITGEEMDVANTMQTLLTALTTMASNPAVLQDKAIRKTFFKILELAGVSPVELGAIESAAEQAQPQSLPGGVQPPSPQPQPVQPVAGNASAAL